jgi:hypothetical protein
MNAALTFKEKTMEFVLAFQQPIEVYEAYGTPEAHAQSQAWKHYMMSMGAAGVLRGGKQLDPRRASTVSFHEGRRQLRHGASSLSEALLGGYVVIEVDTLEDALKWAELSPSSLTGCTEVFPVLPIPGA